MKRMLIVTALAFVACSSSQTPATPTVAPTPPIPIPTPQSIVHEVVKGCPPLAFIRLKIHQNFGPKGQELNPKSPGRVGGFAVIDSTPFFDTGGPLPVPCNTDHNNCATHPATLCEDSHGAAWTEDGSFPLVVQCYRGVDPGCPDTGVQLIVRFDKPGQSVITACPREDAPRHYVGGRCGSVNVQAF